MKRKLCLLIIAAALLLSGCAMRRVDEMYALPRRSEEFNHLQSAIDAAMEGLSYAAPISGDNQQTVQSVDLNGDGVEECLVFAAGKGENPLQVLIFTQDDNGRYRLSEVIECSGSAFEQVEYVNFDGKPGAELVLGRQVSENVLRRVSVYSFASGSAEQLFVVGYSRFLTCDLDDNGRSEVLVLRPGESETAGGMAVLYSSKNNQVERSVETELSEAPGNIRRMIPGRLQDGTSAVFVASASGENSVVTDVYAIKDGKFTNISRSGGVGTNISTLHNFYVYAEDIDSDGVMEIPGMISMKPVSEWREGEQKSLLRWFAIDSGGREVDKLYTFHYYVGGWYVQLDSTLARRISVAQEEGTYTFYLWNENYDEAAALFTIYVFTGASRDRDAQSGGRFLLYQAEGVAYGARLETAASQYGITEDYLTDSFRMIRQDWRTGES